MLMSKLLQEYKFKGKYNALKYLLLIVIVLTSLCANMPNLPFLNVPSQSVTSGIEASNEDIYVNVNALPTEVSGGGSITLYFQIMNKANYNLEDVSLNLYDPCVFNNGESKENPIGPLKPNRTSSWSWPLQSDIITLNRDCELKFTVSYKGKFTFYQDVAVLSQPEYNTRLLQGTLKNIPITSSFSSSPLQIFPTFTEEQPLLDGSNYDMKINYAYAGNGFINVTDVEIKVPDNLQVSSCKDYTGTGTLSLNKILKFINKKASSSLCTFTTKASQLIDIKSLTITATYIYTIDSSVPVTVKGTSTSQPSTGTSG